MKRILTILVFALSINLSFGQNKTEAEKVVKEGIALHDKGDYKGAIAKYDKALKLDKDNLFALVEKAMSLMYSQKNEEAIKTCQQALSKHDKDENLKLIYVTLGNAYDGIGKPVKALESYNKGIKEFPNFYQLYFNKGVTLSGMNKLDEALECFEKSVKLNPNHASSHNAIARISSKRIPSVMAYCRFLSLEPQGKRAKENLVELKKKLIGNVEKTGKNAITINIDGSMLNDTTEDGKNKENNFSSVDMILSFSSALDHDDKNKKKSEVELFINKMEVICSTLETTKKDNHGFYWDFYAPYFIEMDKNGMIEAFAYIAFSSSDDAKVEKWIKSHKAEVDKFLNWSKNFTWE